jgi:hypothetical protein
MKTVIYVILAFVSVCSLLADEITVQSFPIKASFPSLNHLLDQPSTTHEGKVLTIPYMLCGALREEDIKKYCIIPDLNQSKATTKTILPNGAVCHVIYLSDEIIGGGRKIKSKIMISGPKNQTMESEFTIFHGDGLLLRCETGDSSKSAEIVVLQIKKNIG